MVTQDRNATPRRGRARSNPLGLVDVAQVLEELDRMALEERLALLWPEELAEALAAT